MPDTVRPDASRRRYDHEGAVVHAAARRLGLQVGTLGQRVRAQHIHLQVATVIAEAVRLGDHRLADRLYDPIHAARLALQPEPVTPELIEAEERADAEEAIAQARYLATPTPENRRAWIRGLEMQRARSLELLLALRGEEEA